MLECQLIPPSRPILRILELLNSAMTSTRLLPVWFVSSAFVRPSSLSSDISWTYGYCLRTGSRPRRAQTPPDLRRHRRGRQHRRRLPRPRLVPTSTVTTHELSRK